MMWFSSLESTLGRILVGELGPRLRTDGGFVEVVGTECVRGDESGV